MGIEPPVIRPAVLDDITDLVAAFEAHHSSMGCAWVVDRAVLSRTFAQAIASPDWLCLTGDGCLMLAVVFESPLGAGRLAQELCVSAGRGRFDALLDLYEDWARAKGCQRVALGCEQRHATFARLYGRRGYALAESTFMKVL